ncbi:MULTISPECIES: hypothetical protein [Fischerella]|uniref:hypothetical protein n=1 Tax=Fischerella TaxID=1190 RepID=UPI00031D15AD|nr:MULTISPECIES: hypothetical protein [Fischerella]
MKITYIEERHTPPFHLLATGRVGGKTTPVLVAVIQPSEHPIQSVIYKDLPPKFVSEINAFRKTPAGDFVLRLYRDRNS